MFYTPPMNYTYRADDDPKVVVPGNTKADALRNLGPVARSKSLALWSRVRRDGVTPIPGHHALVADELPVELYRAIRDASVQDAAIAVPRGAFVVAFSIRADECAWTTGVVDLDTGASIKVAVRLSWKDGRLPVFPEISQLETDR